MVQDKQTAVEKHDHEVHWAARWIVAMYSLAGRSHMTGGLVPVSRRRTKKPEPATEREAEPTRSVENIN